MILRALVILAVAFSFDVLLTVHVTLPAVTVAGLLAWAVLSSLAALAYRRAYRREADR